MREIKVKVYVKDDLHSPDQTHFIDIKWWITEWESRILQEHKSVQYLWLQDKEWKMIFEWDIIEFMFSTFLPTWEDQDFKKWFIKFENQAFIFESQWDEYTLCNLCFDSESDIEIIWNIYENPELLN